MHRPFLVLLSVLVVPTLAHAQSIDASGHWEGSVQLPAMEVAFQVDFERTATGAVAGTISIPTQHLSGLPLTAVTLEGNTITFGARSDQVMTGVVSADRRSISGDYGMPGLSARFTLTRTGEPNVTLPPKSAAIPVNLEGRWAGTLDVDGGLHLVLTLANEANVASRGQIVNLDEGGLTLPLRIATDGRSVTLTSSATPGSFTGTLSPDGSEIAGVYQQDGRTVPLTFTRAR